MSWTPPTSSLTLYADDGRPIVVRHIRPDDADRLAAMFWKLSSETRWRRFFVPLDHVDPNLVAKQARRLAEIDVQREVALIALVHEDGTEAAVAVVRYIRPTPDADQAEAAIVVRDDYQGLGLGSELFDLLIQVALVQGIRRLPFITQGDNRRILHMLERAGIPYDSHLIDGMYEVELQLSDPVHPLAPYVPPELRG